MTFTTMTIEELCVSPYNARRNKLDQHAIEGMAASLLNRGQLYPLVVHRMADAEGMWGVFAGGRRYRAFALLIARGSLPADHPIEVITREEAEEGELRDLSVAENLVRLALRPYEIYAAVARAHACGRALQDIAETNGQTLLTVRRWVALGNLAPAIFAALENEEINSRQAEALAATDDHALQLHVFHQIMQLPVEQRRPDVIRRLLKIGDEEALRLLRYVGEAAYRDAGGRYALDLFADEADQRGRVVDEGLLMELVESKLSSMRDVLRAQSGRADLRFEKDYPRDTEYGGVARGLEIVAEPLCRDAADTARLDYLENEMAELEARAARLLDQPETPERAALIADIDVEYVPIENEWEEIRARRTITLPAGDIFGTLVIEADGSLEIRWWWASRKAKRAAEKLAAEDAAAPATATAEAPVSLGPVPRAQAQAAERDMLPRPHRGGGALDQSNGYGERQKADAIIRQEQGATADGVQILRSLRREALRCGLLDNADIGEEVGRDYAMWVLLRSEICHEYGTELGARRLAGGYDSGWEASQPHIVRSIAGGRWEKELKVLRAHPSMARAERVGRSPENDRALLDAFRAYLAEDEAWKVHAGAILAGLMLERSMNADGYTVPLHDLLAAEIGLTDADIAAYVEPTSELVDLFPRAQRLALVEEHVDRATFAALGKLKAAELSGPVARALQKGMRWVHPLMRFRLPAGSKAPDQAPATTAGKAQQAQAGKRTKPKPTPTPKTATAAPSIGRKSSPRQGAPA